jgi:hypothetical protein
MRQLAANNTQKITNQHKTSKEKCQTIYTKWEWDTIKSLQHKINQNQLIIKADNTSVISQKKKNYQNKIKEFITKTNFTKLPHNITNKLQQNICNNINKCNKIINTIQNGNTSTQTWQPHKYMSK